MNQEIRFCTARDGVRIAYAKAGKGIPILRVGTFLTHLEYDWRSPIWRPWLENFSRFHTFYRYDARGCGLSDRDVQDFSIAALLNDIETVVEAAGLERFALFGMSQGGAAAIWYAARHPEQVTRLILYGGYLQGSAHADPGTSSYEEYQFAKKMFRLTWVEGSPGYRRWFPTNLLPEGTTEQIKWLADLQRVSTSSENAVRLFEGYSHVDVRLDATKVLVPTLVLHGRADATVAFEHGREVAAHIPNARFVPLDSKNHILLPSEKAWRQFWPHVYTFLGVPEDRYLSNLGSDSATSIVSRFADLTLREREVLHLVAQGYRNREIAASLVLSPKTIRNYVSRIFSKLGVSSRGEAIVLARESGFGEENA